MRRAWCVVWCVWCGRWGGRCACGAVWYEWCVVRGMCYACASLVCGGWMCVRVCACELLRAGGCGCRKLHVNSIDSLSERCLVKALICLWVPESHGSVPESHILVPEAHLWIPPRGPGLAPTGPASVPTGPGSPPMHPGFVPGTWVCTFWSRLHTYGSGFRTYASHLWVPI